MYSTSRWEHKREIILRRDGYIDQIAKRYGRIEEADTVHHIFPRETYPQYQWENWNLISVSKETHNTLHDRESHELTEKGKELMRRTARKKGIQLD